ncbi:MAG: hypothetical protein LBH00_06995 [Planctomycetaceae bacterium]|jgi:DNA-directed RNA polymerase specialized sigma24 family protein|nr:hypothetical protein [Planctomycetaceae bacterium]
MSEFVSQWVLQLANGDAGAAQQIWNDYFGKIVRLARRKLDGFPKRDYDEEDVAISAMHSFYQGFARHKFDHIQHRDDLWKILVTITARKATAHRRHQLAQKRGGGRIRGESVFGQPDGGRGGGIADVLSTEPTPEFAASVAENCKVMLAQLQDETLRQIALWTLEGSSTEEIAAKLGCVRRTVERKLERIREIWSPPEKSG